ncbi:hypothetical protein A3K64_03980 [Candidatus Micrarchaeota archaeon RBG_16_36_9]|nr:MAG: hypothetical protein A3K64_03980 [Candidatus Micrarchaeota archaeon RBG_16_36_9]
MNNYITKTKGRVEKSIISREKRDELVKEAEEILGNQRWGWKAEIDGFCAQLETNSRHSYDFWFENWFSMPKDVKSHVRIYNVLKDPEGKPHAYYNPETKTAVIHNTEYYGQVKSWALGEVCDFAEDQHDIHSIHGSCVEVNGDGIALIAPTNTGKSTHCYALLGMEGARLHSDDWLYVRFSRGEKGIPSAEISERNFYIRTNIAKVFPEVKPLLEKCSLENVEPITEEEIDKLRKDKVDESKIREIVSDPFIAHDYSRAMLDPNWIAGPEKFVDTTRLKKVLLLKRDRNDPEIIRKLEAEEAIDYLMKQPEKFLNPYLIVNTPEKDIIRKNFFKRLFGVAPPYLVNTHEPVDIVQHQIRELVKNKI